MRFYRNSKYLCLVSLPGMLETPRLQAKHVFNFRTATFNSVCFNLSFFYVDHRIQKVGYILDPAIKSQDDEQLIAINQF